MKKKPKHAKRSKRKTVPVPLLHKRKRERDELEQKIKRLQADWRAERRAHQKTVHRAQQDIVRLQHKLDMYKRAEERHTREAEREKELRKQQEAENWAAYDRCVDATTSHERALFETSPAYQKYQQWRRDGYHATESKRVDAIKYISARGRLDTGDWISP